MLAKVIIITTMILIVVALISGLFFLIREKGDSKRTVKALSWRIGLSLALFFFLFIAFRFNWITPHAL